jgi:muconolactone delta-isomerase
MTQYMVDIKLPNLVTQEFISLIPAQRARINTLFEDGKILSYTLAHTRTQLWVVMQAKDEREVEAILEEFPLIKYMQFTIHELSFHNMVSSGMPLISLN